MCTPKHSLTAPNNLRHQIYNYTKPSTPPNHRPHQTIHLVSRNWPEDPASNYLYLSKWLIISPFIFLYVTIIYKPAGKWYCYSNFSWNQNSGNKELKSNFYYYCVAKTGIVKSVKNSKIWHLWWQSWPVEAMFFLQCYWFSNWTNTKYKHIYCFFPINV